MRDVRTSGEEELVGEPDTVESAAGASAAADDGSVHRVQLAERAGDFDRAPEADKHPHRFRRRAWHNEGYEWA